MTETLDDFGNNSEHAGSIAIDTPVQGRIGICGRLLAPEAKLTLHYGYGTTVTQSQTIMLRQADAPAHEGLVPPGAQEARAS